MLIYTGMKKKLTAIILCLCLVAAGAAMFTACGEEEVVRTQYSYYTFTYDDELKGLVLDVSYSSLLPSGAPSLPSESYFYKDNADAETTEHETAVPVVKVADGAFEGIGTLTSVSVPDSYYYLGEGCFANCKKLETVTLSRNVSSIPADAFSGCYKLETIAAPETGAATVTSVGDRAFSSCLALRSTGFDFGDGVTIGERAYFYTVSLRSIDLTGASAVGSRAFQGWLSVQTITAGSSSGWAADWNEDCSAVIN